MKIEVVDLCARCSKNPNTCNWSDRTLKNNMVIICDRFHKKRGMTGKEKEAKPMLMKLDGDREYYCGCCAQYICEEHEEYKYMILFCSFCGTKIDWREEA